MYPYIFPYIAFYPYIYIYIYIYIFCPPLISAVISAHHQINVFTYFTVLSGSNDSAHQGIIGGVSDPILLTNDVKTLRSELALARRQLEKIQQARYEFKESCFVLDGVSGDAFFKKGWPPKPYLGHLLFCQFQTNTFLQTMNINFIGLFLCIQRKLLGVYFLDSNTPLNFTRRG